MVVEFSRVRIVEVKTSVSIVVIFFFMNTLLIIIPDAHIHSQVWGDFQSGTKCSQINVISGI